MSKNPPKKMDQMLQHNQYCSVMILAIRLVHPQKGNPRFPFPSLQFSYKQPFSFQFQQTLSISLPRTRPYTSLMWALSQQYRLQARRTMQLMGSHTDPRQQLSSVPYSESEMESERMPPSESNCFSSPITLTILSMTARMVSCSPGPQSSSLRTPVKKGKRLMQPTRVTNSLMYWFLAATDWSLKRRSTGSRHSSMIFLRTSSFFSRQYRCGRSRPRCSAIFSSPSEKKQIQDMRSTCCLEIWVSVAVRGQSSSPLPMKLPRSQSSLHRQRYFMDRFTASFSIRLLWLWVFTKYRYHFSNFQQFSRRRALREASVSVESSPWVASSISLRRGMTRVGGFISKMSWQTNLSSGIMELISKPRICSLPIQPKRSIFRIQLWSTWMTLSGWWSTATERWKPSSHRKPLGKMSREGVKVQEQSSSCLRSEFCVQRMPQQKEVPPCRLNKMWRRNSLWRGYWCAGKQVQLRFLLFSRNLYSLNWEEVPLVMKTSLLPLNSPQKTRMTNLPSVHQFFLINLSWLFSQSTSPESFLRFTFLYLSTSTRCFTSSIKLRTSQLQEVFMVNPNTRMSSFEWMLMVSLGPRDRSMETSIVFFSCLLTEKVTVVEYSLWSMSLGSLFSTVIYVIQYAEWLRNRLLSACTCLISNFCSHPSSRSWYLTSVSTSKVRSSIFSWMWASPSWLIIFTYSPLLVFSYQSRDRVKYCLFYDCGLFSQYPIPQFTDTLFRSPRWNNRCGLFIPKSFKVFMAQVGRMDSVRAMANITSPNFFMMCFKLQIPKDIINQFRHFDGKLDQYFDSFSTETPPHCQAPLPQWEAESQARSSIIFERGLLRNSFPTYQTSWSGSGHGQFSCGFIQGQSGWMYFWREFPDS